MDPTRVDGFVSVEVDQTERVWKVEVTNRSEQKLSYEMMGKVPRGLGLEVWDHGHSENGLRVHAENLAKFLFIDGFPADIREISPGESVRFQLDPESMSTTSDLAQARWERAKRNGYYDCRVFFGVYSSRLLRVTPGERRGFRGGNEPTVDVLHTVDPNPGECNEGLVFGLKLRRMLNEKNRALVSWSRGSDREGHYHITYTTCLKVDLESMEVMDEGKPMWILLPDLIAQAEVLAREKLADCTFEGLLIDSCKDDEAKHYASIYFVDGRDYITINLLLNGATTETAKLSVTGEQYKQLKEFGIPRIRDNVGKGKSTIQSELDSED